MLDDLKLLHQRDKADALGTAAKQWQQTAVDFLLPKNSAANSVIYVAAAEAAIPAEIILATVPLKKPFIIQDGKLPAYAGSNTAVITAEMVGFPEHGLVTGLMTLLTILEKLKAIDPIKLKLHDVTGEWLPEIPTIRNPAKQLAQELMGRSIVIQSGPFLAPAAHYWQLSFNQKSHQLAWQSQYPVTSYHELSAWTGQPVQRPYAVIELTTELESPDVQTSAHLTRRLLSGRRPESLLVPAKGETILEQVLWAAAFGDFVAIYLAVLNGIDPSVSSVADKFKQELTKHG